MIGSLVAAAKPGTDPETGETRPINFPLVLGLFCGGYAAWWLSGGPI